MSAVLQDPQFAAGALVKARGREWIVLPGSSVAKLRLRPLTGTEQDVVVLAPVLETEPVAPASFPPPSAQQRASQESALLLRDALLMSLRRGAGPFRSFGYLAFEPRTYQLVPLLMALKLDTVRLLIADDVGVGKTIEAGMIARELLDRNEIRRFAVLCPPHLVDQWVHELDDRFHIKTVAVTAASAARLERGLPATENIFTAHAHTVVSLDYIKADRRRLDFVSRCPEFVIVDEAHTCTNAGAGRHQRYELLKALATDNSRHIVLLTATPHSGDEQSFHNLLGLLDPEFEQLATASGSARERLRERLARHFVQRRRPDIDEWKDSSVFPARETGDLPYALTGRWERFFESVLDYCSTVVERAGADKRRQRLNIWGTLALMRCVSSSPDAAAQALRTRMGLEVSAELEEALREQIFDGSEEAQPEDDGEPLVIGEDGELVELLHQAEALSGETGDPKLQALVTHLRTLLDAGFSPVVFCRYIATAHYLHGHLKSRYAGVTVDVITGELLPEERKQRIEAFDPESKNLLIATDCLSEGVNLQQPFSAVVHYDLSWNPTRHEQREGRVDRFGQPRKLVRATLMYGRNNPVDAAVLEVILRKAKKIRDELGVPVPVPDDEHSLTQALMQAVLLRSKAKERRTQMAFDFENMPTAKAFDVAWTNLAEKAKRNRTVFAQTRLQPAEVLPEWQKMQAALGNVDDVRRFAERALARLGSGLNPRGTGYRLALNNLPESLRERLHADGLHGTFGVSFNQPPAQGTRFVHRSHPLTGTLADGLLESTLADAGIPGESSSGAPDPAVLGRAGCWATAAVESRTTVLLLRLRHQLSVGGSGAGSLLVEEAAALALPAKSATDPAHVVAGPEPLSWLASPVAEQVDDRVRQTEVERALAQWPQWQPLLEGFAGDRANALLADHVRVREASDPEVRRGRRRDHTSVAPLLPVDVIGVFVLLPALGF
ncbi:helicase-related protein [Variovorax sp.]|uniref:helicase-related protein n=1 Tax=Variovorax sp. TaxID=1871043 RepID=UPI003BA9A0B8